MMKRLSKKVILAMSSTVFSLLLACSPNTNSERQVLDNLNNKLNSIHVEQKKIVENRREYNRGNDYVTSLTFAPHFNSDSKIEAELEEIKGQLKKMFPPNKQNEDIYKTVERKWVASSSIAEFISIFHYDEGMKGYEEVKIEAKMKPLTSDVHFKNKKMYATRIDTSYYELYYNTFDILSESFN